MIPAIGLMIGAYIITRMIIVLTDTKKTGLLVMIFAVLTILISIYCIYTLFASGVDVSNLLKY